MSKIKNWFSHSVTAALFAVAAMGFAFSANATVYKLYCSPNATGAASEDCLTPETAGYPMTAIDLAGTTFSPAAGDEVQVVFLPGTYHLQAGTSWWAGGSYHGVNGFAAARFVLTSSTGDFRDVTLDFDDIINPTLLYVGNGNGGLGYRGLTFTHIESTSTSAFCGVHGSNVNGVYFDGCRFLECLANPEKTTSHSYFCNNSYTHE